MKDRILNKFDEKSLLKKWEKSFPVGGLKYDLYEHWKEYVPIIFDPKYDLHSPTQLYVDESLVHKILFDPMEAFMCEGKDRDSVLQVLEQLSEYNEKSLIFTSSGGGICDCGDVEAWKADPYCTQHEPSTLNYSSQTANNEEIVDISSNDALGSPTKALLSENANNLMLPDLIDRLPENLVNRASSVLLSTLQYSVFMLTWPDALTLPQLLLTEPDINKPMDEQPTDDSLFDLFYSKEGQKYITMLYNDEVHTYEQVITTLCRAIDCTHKEGVDFATIVDRDGRSPVYISAQKTECERVKTSIERSTSRHGSRALRVCVFEARIVAHQSFALRCLSWIANFISYSDGLKLLACNLTLQPIDNEAFIGCFDGMAENGQVGSTLLEHLLLHDTSIWKAARMKCHEILISNMLLFPETKKRLALIFTQHYSRILDDYIENDVEGHSLSVISTSVQLYTVPSLHYATMAKTYVSIEDLWEDDSISDFSVQIFTTPSIAKYLIVHKDVLTVVIETFIQIAKKYRNADGKLNFDRNQPHTPFRRAQYILNDLHYLLSAPPKASEWTHLLKRNFLNGFNSMLNLLSSIQNMDLIVRQTRQHVDYEPEWETAFNLTYKLIPCLLGFEQWIASSCNEELKNNSESIRRVISPDNLLVKAFGRTSRALFRLNKKFGVEKMKYPIICASQLSHATQNDSDSSLEMDSLSTMLNIEVIKYDVASQPVSVHLPITRLYIGLYLQLLELGLNYDSPCLLLGSNNTLTSHDIPRTADKNASQQTEDINNNCNNDENTATDNTTILNARKDTIINKDYGKTPSPTELMEYPLRCIVLCAQVLAGMWRRNGYSLLNQCFLYKNAKWRHYMYDRDIMALQIGASIMLQKSYDSSGFDTPLDRKQDTFLLRLLNKYDLSLFLQRFTAQCLMFMNIDMNQHKSPPKINQNMTNFEFQSIIVPDLLEKIPLIVALQSRTLDIKSMLSSLHDRVTWTHTFNQSKNKVDKDKVDKQMSQFTDCYISDWWSDQEIVKQNITLLEEYLSLVIYITSERYNVKIGRTTEIDIIRRQVIHQLCLGPLAHSELCKALPENSSKHPDLENIIKEVAQLKKSTEPTAKMKYVLRVEFFSHFDPFYYHYTKGELNKANEYRQLRLGQDLKIKGLIPPKPPQFNTAFTVISGLLCRSEFLLQTQMVILYAYYMNMSFNKENKITSKLLPLLTHITEELVHQVIHLFCLALYEISSKQDNQIGVAYLTKVLNLGIPQILMKINAIDTSTPHSELITFALKMFNEIYEDFGQVSPLIANTAQNKISRENMDIVNVNSSKTFNTVLTQQDELPLNLTTHNVIEKEISSENSLNKMVNSKKSGEVARNRRHKILAQMSRAQKAFIKTHKDLWESVAAPPQQQNAVEQNSSCGVTDTQQSTPILSNQQGAAVGEVREKERNVLPNNLSSQKLYQTDPNVKTSFASCVFSPHRLKEIMGRQQNLNGNNGICNVSDQSIISNNFPKFTCILCQEENSIDVSLTTKSGGQNDPNQENGPQNTLVMAAFVQNTTSLSRLNTMSPKNPQCTTDEINDNELDVRMNHIAPKAYDTIVRSCGHVMHESCWSRLCENVVKRERTQLSRFRFYHSAIDIDRREYVCPLCNALGNTALPLLPHHPYLIGLTLTPHRNERKEAVSIEENRMDVVNSQQVNTDDTSIDWQNACTSNQLTSTCGLNLNPVLSDDDLYGDSIPFYAWIKLIRAWVKLELVKSRSVTENLPLSAITKKVGKHAKRISNDSSNNRTNRKSGGEEKGHLKHEPTLNENLAIEKENDGRTFLKDATAAFIEDCFGPNDLLPDNANIYKEYFKCWLASNMSSSTLKESTINKPANVTSISLSTMNMIQAFSSSILTISTESHPYDENNETLPLTVWQSLASTIQSIYYYAAFETNIRFPTQNISDDGHSDDHTENSKRESESDIKPSQDLIISEELTSLPIRYVQCLKYLVTFVNYLSSNILSTNPNLISQQAIHAFSKMFGLYTTHSQFLPSKGSSEDKRRPPIKLQLYGTPLVVNAHDNAEFFSEGYVEFEPVLDVLLANSDNIDHPFLAQNMMDSNADSEDGEYITSSDETEEAHMPVNMHYYENNENSEEPLIVPFNEATNAIPRPDRPNELIRTLNDFKHARTGFNFILDTDMFSNMIILTQSCHHVFSINTGDKNSPLKDELKTVNHNNSSLSQNFASLEDLENQIDYTSLVVPNDLNENEATISSEMDVGPTNLVTTQLSSDSFNDNSFEKYLSPPPSSTNHFAPKTLSLNGFCPMDAFDRFVVRFSFLGEFVKSLLFFGCPNISQSYTGDLPLINFEESQKSEYAFTYTLCSYLSSEHFGFFKNINEPKTKQSPTKKKSSPSCSFSQKVQSFQTFMRREMEHLIHDDKSRMYQSYLLTLNVKRGLLPFLYCTAIYMHYMTNVPIPTHILKVPITAFKPFDLNNDDKKPESKTLELLNVVYNSLCNYIGIESNLYTFWRLCCENGIKGLTKTQNNNTFDMEGKMFKLIFGSWLNIKDSSRFNTFFNWNADKIHNDKIKMEGIELFKPQSLLNNVKETNDSVSRLRTWRLIKLPHDYADLIGLASTFVCPTQLAEQYNQRASTSYDSKACSTRAPTLCLVCGTLLCSQSYCCQTHLILDARHGDRVVAIGSMADEKYAPGLIVWPVGACMAHSFVCGAGTGLFLRIRECQILMLFGRTRGTFVAPPYIDAYGETDQGLKRGNPLFLCPERYRAFEKLWITNSIPDEIVRSLESNPNLLSIDWQHL